MSIETNDLRSWRNYKYNSSKLRFKIIAIEYVVPRTFIPGDVISCYTCYIRPQEMACIMPKGRYLACGENGGLLCGFL
jgi:hypothetical protein